MKTKKYMKSGLRLYGASIAVGAMPTMGNANAAKIQGNVSGGMANFSSVYPAVGSMIGAGVVIKHTKGLTNMMNKKRRYK